MTRPGEQPPPTEGEQELSADLATHPEMRRLRHDMMGRLNALTLVATLLPLLEPAEVLDYLSSVDSQADELVGLLDRTDALIAELRKERGLEDHS
jgi:hypothetical protein